MELLEGIYSRRSVRHYTEEPVGRDAVMEIINAGRWAPSGLNNQPWRFVVIRDREARLKLSALTRYRRIIQEAQVCMGIFIDRDAMYHDLKDHLAMGACIQNMLLAAHALGLGAVWLGEILKNADEARRLFELPQTMELMAVLAIGHPAGGRMASERKEIGELLIKEI